MKTLLTFGLFLICSGSAISQDSVLTFVRVQSLDSLSKQSIYDKVKLWTVKVFENTRGALQVDDKDGGMLAFDASTSALSPAAPKVDMTKTKESYKLLPFYHSYIFKLKIQIRDGKYRVEFSEVKLKVSDDYHLLTSTLTAPYKYTFNKQRKSDEEWADAKITFVKFVDDLCDSLYKDVSKKDDW